MALNINYIKSNFSALIAGIAIAGATIGYDVSRPTIEGEIISSNFSNKEVSELNIRNNETGSIDKIILGTILGKDIKTFKLGFAQSYQGKAEELENKLAPGQNIKLKVYNDNIKEAYRINGLRLDTETYNAQIQQNKTKETTKLFSFN